MVSKTWGGAGRIIWFLQLDDFPKTPTPAVKLGPRCRQEVLTAGTWRSRTEFSSSCCGGGEQGKDTKGKR